MTPVSEILTLLKIFFSPFFIINVCQNFNGQLTFLYVPVVQKSNSVSHFGDENNDKKRHIKVRRWTLKIIFIHKIFTIYQWSPFIYHTNQAFGHKITTYIKEISNLISFLSLSETVQIPYSCSYCSIMFFGVTILFFINYQQGQVIS